MKAKNNTIKLKNMDTKNNSKKNEIRKNGFTLIEILVVIGMIAVLATIVIIAINPARQFAQGRNTQRTSNVNAILNAIGQNIADNKGIFTCGTATVPIAIPSSSVAVPSSFITVDIPSAAKEIGAVSGNIDLAYCLVPKYVSIMTTDPTNGTLDNTKYYVVQDDSPTGGGRITVFAVNVESALGDLASQKLIAVTR